MKKCVAYIIVIILSAFLQRPLFAQDDSVWERVYIATDKQTYVSGDKVWCSAYCFTKGDGVRLSDFSSTVYLELQTNEQVVLTAKIALIDGRGAGAIELPPTLPTGNYKLVAYTKQNRNELGFAPAGKIISVYNVLTTERVEGNVEIADYLETDGNTGFTAKYGAVDIVLPKEPIKPGEEFHFTLDNRFKDAVTLNVSVFNRDPLPVEENYGIVTFSGVTAVEERGKIVETHLPDYEGEVIKLKTTGVTDKTIQVSFYGNQSNYFVPSVDESGNAIVVTPNIFGANDMFYSGATSAVIEDPFLRRVSGGIPKLQLSSSMERELLDRGFSMQVGKRFDADTLYERLPVRPNILFDENMIVYNLDDYTRFPTMQEVIVEYVSEIKIRSEKKKRSLAILMEQPGAVISNPQFGSGVPLILLDGIPVTDHEKIIAFDPLLVKRIEIFMDPFSVGPRFFEGVANFVTYKGDMSGFDFGTSLKILPYQGALYPMSFTGSSIREGDPYPDYRQTVYWHPIIDMDGGEKREVRCIAPLYNGNFQVVVEGISSSGEAFYYRANLGTQHIQQVKEIDDTKLMEQIKAISQETIESKPMNKTLKEERVVVPPPVPVTPAVSVPVPVSKEQEAPKKQQSVKEETKVVVPAVAVPVVVPVEPAPQTAAKPAVKGVVKQSAESAVNAAPPVKATNLKSDPIKKEREGQLKEGVKYKSSIEIR